MVWSMVNVGIGVGFIKGELITKFRVWFMSVKEISSLIFESLLCNVATIKWLLFMLQKCKKVWNNRQLSWRERINQCVQTWKYPWACPSAYMEIRETLIGCVDEGVFLSLNLNLEKGLPLLMLMLADLYELKETPKGLMCCKQSDMVIILQMYILFPLWHLKCISNSVEAFIKKYYF